MIARRCLIRACSRQADLAQKSARAAPSVSALWNVSWCGRGLEGLQLMRKSLDSTNGVEHAVWLSETVHQKRIAARTSWKRVVRHSFGLKAPRGWGWLTNPRKAACNRVYNRTTVSCSMMLGSFAGLAGGLVFVVIM